MNDYRVGAAIAAGDGYTIVENASLQGRNTFRVPARAAMLVDVRKPEAFGELFGYAMLRTQPLLVLGEGSNVLFTRDWPGVVLAVAALGIRVLHDDGTRARMDTLGSLALLRPIDFNPYDAANHPNGYQPSGGANYNLAYNSGFGSQLRNVAQMIKLNLGLRAVTIDLGNWDTHVGQGNPAQSYDWFGNQVSSLSDGLAAFYTDLSSNPSGNLMQRVNVLVLSEFGRRVLENADSGTDHECDGRVLDRMLQLTHDVELAKDPTA